MTILRIFALSTLQIVVLAGVCFGQNISSSLGPGPNGSRQFSATFSGPPPFAMRPVTGAPYSGEEVSEHTQTLADGTHITQKPASRYVSRDSQGRTRTEHPFGMQLDDELRIVEITDPVEGYQYTLDPVNKIAHRVKLPTMTPAPASGSGSGSGGGGVVSARLGTLPAGELRTLAESAPPSAARLEPPARPQISSEPLDTQTIEGLAASGRRTTRTLPVNSQGNDRPIVTTSELWMSDELHVMLLSTNHDPRMGDSVTRLTNISRAEPDPALFRVPPDYQMVDEEGRFTIQFKIPAK